MNAIIRIDKAGRLVLPKSIRDALRVGPGDALEVTREDDRVILSPVRARAGLQKELGVWVYRSGEPANASIPDLVDRQRQQRGRQIRGEPD